MMKSFFRKSFFVILLILTLVFGISSSAFSFQKLYSENGKHNLIEGNSNSLLVLSSNQIRNPPRRNPPRRNPPRPPNTRQTLRNRVKPPRTLDPSCGDFFENGLVALLPEVNPVDTNSQDTSIIFYIGYPERRIQKARFILNKVSFLSNGGSSETSIYRKEFSINTTPGLIEVSAAPTNVFAFEPNIYYHWYFKLFVQCENSARPDILTVDGFLRYNPSSTNPWYDNLAEIARQMSDTSPSMQVQSNWLRLLSSIGASSLSESRIGESH